MMFGNAARRGRGFEVEALLGRQPGYGTPGYGEGVDLGNASPRPTSMFGAGPQRLGPDIEGALVQNALKPRHAGSDGHSRHDHGGDGPVAAHYALHGRGPTGMFGAKKRSTGQKVLDGLSNFFLASAASKGDYSAQLMLRERFAQKGERRKAEAEFAEHDRFVRNLLGRGVSLEDAELYAQNPEKFAEEVVTKFRTREASEGESIRTPGIGSTPDQVWTAPKIVEDGPNRVQIDPITGASRTLYQGTTPAGWAAQESGYQPGTPEAHNFMRDYHLDGQGPTAVQMQRESLGQSNINNIRQTSTSTANSLRDARTSAANKANTPAGTVLNEKGEVVVVYPNGRTQTLRNSRPVAGQGRGRGGAGRAPAGASGGTSPEGTVIEGPGGKRLVKRGGNWVPAQ
jgi:hypothetical protein